MTARPRMSGRAARAEGGGADLPYWTTFPILGVPMAFGTNAPEVLAAVKGAFGAWGAPAPADLLTHWTGRVRLIVSAESEPRMSRRFSYQIDEGLGQLTVVAGRSVGYADSRRGEATAWITETLSLDTANFQYGMIQALTLFVITGRDRYPLHAATLATADTILLLMGESGVGKSTLSYALHEAGLAVLGEDVAYLSLHPTPRVWATPGPLHLVPEATRHFVRLRPGAATVQANGKEKVGIPQRPADPWRAPRARRVVVCLLSRGAGPAAWSPASPTDLIAHLESAPEGFNRFLNQLPGVARQLAGLPAVRIHLSNDPHEGARVVLDAVSTLALRPHGDPPPNHAEEAFGQHLPQR